DLRGRRSFLRTRTAVWLGEISFAFYLVHQLAIRVGYRALGARTWPGLEGVVVAAGTLGLARAASPGFDPVGRAPVDAPARRRPGHTRAWCGRIAGHTHTGGRARRGGYGGATRSYATHSVGDPVLIITVVRDRSVAECPLWSVGMRAPAFLDEINSPGNPI